MRHRVLPLTMSVLMLTGAVHAAPKEWYEHYGDAQGHIARGRFKEALASLHEARRLKPRSRRNEQTYGLGFTNYFPFYYEGLCYLRLGRYLDAVTAFKEEEKQGEIKDRPEYQDMLKLRAEAEIKLSQENEATERQNKVRLALDAVQRLRREADERYKEGKLDDALIALAKAQTAAEILDLGVRQQISEKTQQIRQEVNEKAEQAKRIERIEKALEAGDRLLKEGNPTDAKLRFEDVLSAEPQNARAQQGYEAAKEQILAYTTRQERESRWQEGKQLYEAGQFEKALHPLSEAAADPANGEANELLQRTRQRLEALRHQKDNRDRKSTRLNSSH